MKKIIITGGLGFIFSHVTEYFLNKGWDVYVIDNLSAGSHPELAAAWKDRHNFHFKEYDVAFASVVTMIKAIDPDYIIHAAAISDVDYSLKQPTKTIVANNNATMNVFDAARQCRNLKRLLYVSTDEVYGECDHAKSEEDIVFPKNPYAVSKAFGSLLRLAYDNSYPELKDKTLETRFCNVFGPRQDDRKVLPAIKRAIAGGKPLELHNGGQGFRQFIHAEEIPPVIDMLLDRGHRTYNVTTGEGYTMNELVELAGRLTGKKVPTIPGKRSGMDMRYEMSPARLYMEFQWKPEISFEDRLKSYLTSHDDIH